MPTDTQCLKVFARCLEAIRTNKLISRESRQDKEFHFQNWFKARLDETDLDFDLGGRNTYPDFRLVASTEGFEVKGLAYPGREANYDCNSQVPSGSHNGRTIFYIFRSEEHTSELQSHSDLVCRLLLEKQDIISVI